MIPHDSLKIHKSLQVLDLPNLIVVEIQLPQGLQLLQVLNALHQVLTQTQSLAGKQIWTAARHAFWHTDRKWVLFFKIQRFPVFCHHYRKKKLLPRMQPPKQRPKRPCNLHPWKHSRVSPVKALSHMLQVDLLWAGVYWSPLRFWGDLTVALQYLKRAYKQERDQLYIWSNADKTSRNAFKLQEEKLRFGWTFFRQT